MAIAPLTIWSNAKYSDALTAKLTQAIEPHRLIAPTIVAANNLAAGAADPNLEQADIAFGQPDPQQVISLPKLKWVHLNSAGYTRYDTDAFKNAIKSRGGAFTNSSSVYDEPCAQHLLAMMLGHSRKLPAAARSGKTWPYNELRYETFLLRGQTAILYGFGAIGRRLAEMLTPFQMNLIAARRNPVSHPGVKVVTPAEADALLHTADHVINILPASDETENYFTVGRLNKIKRGGYFYNIGRGTTIDQFALQVELETGRLGGAYLDVTNPEPLMEDSGLWTAPNCYITPHIGGGHANEFERSIEHFAENLRRFTSGKAMIDRIVQLPAAQPLRPLQPAPMYANMSSIGFFDWLLDLLGLRPTGDAPLDLNQTVTEIDPIAGSVEHFIVTPCGYRIRVPQPLDVSHSVSEMLPNVRQSLAEIPPLPRVVVELMREVQDANSSADSVAHVAASDPVLAAALLRTVNSSAMGLTRKITSVNEAVSYLGLSLVKSVLIRLRLDETLPTTGPAARAAEDLWVHSLAVSYVAEALAERLPGVDRGFVSTVGLLHDIGKLAMISQPSLHHTLEVAPAAEHADTRHREAAALGTDHAGLGASLAHAWGLPSDLVQAIRFHHHPEKAFEPTDPLPLRRAAYVVFVANQLAKLGFAHADDIEIDAIPADAAQVLGIDCSIDALMDANVRRAIGRAILFASENTKQSKTSVKRLIQLRRGQEAMKQIAMAGEASASPNLTLNDVSVVDLFDKESDAASLFRAAGTTREGDIAKLIDAGLFHQTKLDLPPALLGTAGELLRCLLPNLIQTSTEVSVELVQQWAEGVLSLGVRSDALKFTDRVGPATSAEQGLQLLAGEFANVMNLGWVEHVSVSSDGSAMILTAK